MERTQDIHLVSIDKEPFFEVLYHKMSSTKILNFGLLNLICQVTLQGGWSGHGMAKFRDLKKIRNDKKISRINPEMVNIIFLPTLPVSSIVQCSLEQEIPDCSISYNFILAHNIQHRKQILQVHKLCPCLWHDSPSYWQS